MNRNDGFRNAAVFFSHMMSYDLCLLNWKKKKQVLLQVNSPPIDWFQNTSVCTELVIFQDGNEV